MAAPLSDRLTEARYELENLRRVMANAEGLLRFAREDGAVPALLGEVVTGLHAVDKALSAIMNALEARQADGGPVRSVGITGASMQPVPPRRA